jgi:hypothetical protein
MIRYRTFSLLRWPYFLKNYGLLPALRMRGATPTIHHTLLLPARGNLHLPLYIYIKHLHNLLSVPERLHRNVSSVAMLSVEPQIEEESVKYSLCTLNVNSTVTNLITFSRYGF